MKRVDERDTMFARETIEKVLMPMRTIIEKIPIKKQLMIVYEQDRTYAVKGL